MPFDSREYILSSFHRWPGVMQPNVENGPICVLWGVSRWAGTAKDPLRRIAQPPWASFADSKAPFARSRVANGYSRDAFASVICWDRQTRSDGWADGQGDTEGERRTGRDRDRRRDRPTGLDGGTEIDIQG